MGPNQAVHVDDRDEVGPLSPDNKRRRYNGEHSTSVNRAMPPSYGAAPPGVAVGPGTPFPFGQGPPPHPYPPAAVHARRESLPGLRGMVSPPGPMAPPPRPGVGYQQHRLSQGHVPHDRSLTLPPLQTGHPHGAGATVGSSKTAEEQIMNIGFRYKVKVLSQVAPPATKNKDVSRGPLIAVEADNSEAATELAEWLKDMLSKDDDFSAKLIDGPSISAAGTKEDMMAQYHQLVSEWLGKSKAILESITVKADERAGSDAAMVDAAPETSPKSNRKIDENYDVSEDGTVADSNAQESTAEDRGKEAVVGSDDADETMDVDETQKRTSVLSTDKNGSRARSKPVSIIANYSLNTSNVFAYLIPTGAARSLLLE